MEGPIEVRGKAAADELVWTGVRRWAIKQAAAIAVFGAAMFLAAGRLDWVGGLSLVAIMTAYLIVTRLFLVPRNPALYAERSGLQEGTKRWDVVLALLVSETPLFLGVIAGLDLRFGWAAPLPVAPRISLGFLVLPGLVLLSWAMMANNFFSATVRIQEDRGHTVVTTGPYRIVRHPGYVGGFLFSVGLAGVLGSLWALPYLGISLLLLVVRTAMEDRTLRRELPGYEAFCLRARFRLLPGIW